jgi:hypothetical protein
MVAATVYRKAIADFLPPLPGLGGERDELLKGLPDFDKIDGDSYTQGTETDRVSAPGRHLRSHAW